MSQDQKKAELFPCGSESPCRCKKSTQDQGLIIVTDCPVNNWFLMITGIEATRVKIVPAIMAVFNEYKLNITIMNNTIKSIEDFQRKDVNLPTDRALGDMKSLILKNNTQLVLSDYDPKKLVGAEKITFCKNAVRQIRGEVIRGEELFFFHLGNFSMKFSFEKNKEPFSGMRAKYIHIEGIMSDIFLPRRVILYRLIINKVQSLTNSELLQHDILCESMIYEEIRIENSIHVTLPKNFMNGPPFASQLSPFDLTLDPWNIQEKVFVEARVYLIKTLNRASLNDAQRKALITDDGGTNCAIFCDCGQKVGKNCSSCDKNFKKNCAICIKNKLKSDDKDIYKKICSIENMLMVIGPTEIYSSSIASNLLKPTKADDKTEQTIQTICADTYASKSTIQSIGQMTFSHSVIINAIVAARQKVLIMCHYND